MTAVVGQGQLLNFSPGFKWNKVQDLCGNLLFDSFQNRIVHSVAAFVLIQFCFARFPSWRPDGIVVLDVKILSAAIHWNVVVTVTGQSPEFCILVKGVTSGSV